MKKILLPCLVTSLLAGCVSSLPTPNLDQMSEYSSGQVMGDATSYYWLTEKSAFPYSGADYVYSGDYGWYQTDYRWRDGQVRELIREGEQIKRNKLVPYQVHVRFNKDGEAIYQRYRLAGKVLPLNKEQLIRYQQEAEVVINQAKPNGKKGVDLIQGYWDGQTFESCNGQEFNKIEFNQTLPDLVVNRLSNIDSYLAFIGRTRVNSVIVEELLMLADDSQDCIERPRLIDE
ncbi:DUF1481 domain-containing protein [Vibrio sp.]|uniref:DUF1481 domain-containing protein n=1 Tax=Vibrio sp. TaxID=678 RepID=UPI003D0F132E